MIAFKINSKKCIESTILRNQESEGIDVNDLRQSDFFPSVDRYINNNLPSLKKIPIIKKIIRYLFYTNNFIIKIINYFKLSKYFK